MSDKTNEHKNTNKHLCFQFFTFVSGRRKSDHFCLKSACNLQHQNIGSCGEPWLATSWKGHGKLRFKWAAYLNTFLMLFFFLIVERVKKKLLHITPANSCYLDPCFFCFFGLCYCYFNENFCEIIFAFYFMTNTFLFATAHFWKLKRCYLLA